MKKVVIVILFYFFAISNQLFAQNTNEIPVQKSFLSTLSVYPNPIEDKINVNFLVRKDAIVSIKLMDVLGNEIANIHTEKYVVGEYRQSFIVPNKVTKGLYFVKVSVGTDIGIKRISIQ